MAKYSKEKAKEACEDLEIAIQIEWKEAMQIAPYKGGQITEITGPLDQWDRDSIMTLATGTFGQRRRILHTRKDVLYLRNGAGYNVDSPIPVNWYRKGPSLNDLRALLKFYDAAEAIAELEGLSPPPLYGDDVSPPGYVYDNQDAVFQLDECNYLADVNSEE